MNKWSINAIGNTASKPGSEEMAWVEGNIYTGEYNVVLKINNAEVIIDSAETEPEARAKLASFIESLNLPHETSARWQDTRRPLLIRKDFLSMIYIILAFIAVAILLRLRRNLMPTVCMCCGKLLKIKLAGTNAISHGVCRKCLKSEYGEYGY